MTASCLLRKSCDAEAGELLCVSLYLPAMAEPLSLTTGIITLITLAIKLVVGAAGLIDKTVTAQREAVNELRDLQQDLERLKRRMDQIHDILRLLSTNTKDRAFKKLLQEYVLSNPSNLRWYS